MRLRNPEHSGHNYTRITYVEHSKVRKQKEIGWLTHQNYLSGSLHTCAAPRASPNPAITSPFHSINL
jgi:hypothetical protein